MKVHVSETGLINKRIVARSQPREEIISYGEDNIYPQRVEEIMFRSNLVDGAVNATGAFFKGEGFTLNGDLILNREGQTADEVLRFVSQDKATFRGVALHLNFNILGQIVEVTPVEFKTVRLGLPDEDGIIRNVKINANWEKDPLKGKILKDTVKTGTEEFPLYDRDPVRFGALVREAGGIDFFNGMVVYWTPVVGQYPRCTFDSVLESAQTNAEIQEFELGYLQNGMIGATLFKYPGEFEDDTERLKTQREIDKFKGGKNANSIMLLETPEGTDKIELIEPLPSNNLDSLFTQTNSNVEKRISQVFGIPHALLGIIPEGGIFNQEQLRDSYLYYNIRTQSGRAVLEMIFNTLAQDFPGEGTSFGEIEESTFETDAAQANNNEEPPPDEGASSTETTE